MDWLVYLMFFVTIIALSGMVLGYVEGRRKHRLEMQREERLLVEARAREIEAHNQRAELEYRSALVELERFDQRGDTDDRPPSEPSGRPAQSG